MSVLVLIEPGEELSLQAVSLARAVGGPGHGFSVTDDPSVGAYGVQTLHVPDDERLSAYAPGAWAACLEQLIDELQPTAVVAAGTNRGNEVLGHLAARRELPFAANVIAIGSDGTVTRVRWGGSLLEEARIDSDLKILSVAPHTVEATTVNGWVVETEKMSVSLDDADFIVRVVEHAETPSAGISLAEAKVVVSGGRGVGSADGFGMLEELAGLLDAAVGCSRVVTMAGCKGAKRIIAVNIDPEAPIIANADYAVIGDLHEVVPAVSAELRRRRGG